MRLKIAFFSLCLVFLFGCLLNVSPIASLKVQLDPEQIAKDWEVVGEDCSPVFVPNNCQDQPFHAHLTVYKNPKIGEVPETVFLLTNVDTDRIVGVIWKEGNIDWVFIRYCQGSEWKQFLPNPQK